MQRLGTGAAPAAPSRTAVQHTSCRLRRILAAASPLSKGAPGGAGSHAVGCFPTPTLLNNCPHPREVRTLFARDMRESVLAALAAGCTRLCTFQEFPELNVEMDVYRIGTLLEGIRDLVTELVMDGRRVRICVQGSLGVGVFSAMPLALAGVRRILESMDWDATLPESDIRIGGIGEKEVQEDDDVLILVAPQNISGHSIQPFIQEMCSAAGKRPVILINPRLAEIPSANGVMGVRGRSERLLFLASFEPVYHFRLIYNKPFIFPIYGSLRKAFGGPWELYKRMGSTNYNILDEEYVFRRAFAEEPTPSEITDAILG